MAHSEFRSKWRQYIWPIHSFELKKLLPMFLMFLLTTFNYNVLRNAKETLIMTAQHAGAEAIPFIKMWVVPCAILATMLYYRLSQRLSRQAVFNWIFGGFIAYIFLFAFICYPNAESLHLHGLADWMQSWLPAGAKGFTAIIRYWSISTYYIAAELWSSLVFAVLLWGFVNEVTNVNEAKRFYGILGVGAHSSGILAGLLAVGLDKCRDFPILPFLPSGWSGSFYMMNGAVVLSGMVVLGLFWWLHKSVLPPCHRLEERNAEPEKKPKMSIRAMLNYLTNSPYLLCIAGMVLCYNVSVNLIENLWKGQMRLLFPDPSALSAFSGKVTIATDIVATITSLIICSNLIRRRGWLSAAITTPLVIAVTSVMFFGFMFMKHNSFGLFVGQSFGLSPLWLSVMSGALCITLTRASKFAMFDTTKEMAFVPLSTESRLKGKAAIDGVGSRLGKSAGSALQSILLLSCGTLEQSAPFVGIIIPAVLVCWFLAAKSLGQRYNQLLETTAADQPLPEPAATTEPAGSLR